jgi:phage terminase large subunit-like protein
MGITERTNQICRYKNVHASRGKAVRAEPIVARYEKGEIHHIGTFPTLEDEMVSWVPGISKQSPNRVDALVWALTELFGPAKPPVLIPGGH